MNERQTASQEPHFTQLHFTQPYRGVTAATGNGPDLPSNPHRRIVVISAGGNARLPPQAVAFADQDRRRQNPAPANRHGIRPDGKE